MSTGPSHFSLGGARAQLAAAGVGRPYRAPDTCDISRRLRDSCGKGGGYTLVRFLPLVSPFRDDAGAVPRADLGPIRRFVDHDGVHWRVYEHQPLFDRRSRTSLIFESTNVVRRVRAFPDNWHELTDDQLGTLSRMR